MHYLLHNRANRAEPWHVVPLYKCFFSFQTRVHRCTSGWNTATEHKGAGSHSHCRACMGGQRNLRAAVILYIHCMRAANQPAMRVASSIHVSVPEMLNVALNEKAQERKRVSYDKGTNTSVCLFGHIILLHIKNVFIMVI